MADRMAFDDSIDDRVIYLAYRLILGRAPESDDAYAHYRAVSRIDELRAIFAGSFEFRAQSWARLAEFRASRFCAEYEADVAAGVRARGDGRIRIVQTADTQKYAEMLRQSARTVFAFLRGRDIEYESFLGIKRGAHPHHATLNRIFILNEYLDLGYRGWVLYMDADAFINELNFDLRGFLESNADRALIIAPASGEPSNPSWNINAGVFFANLGHPVCAEILRTWKGFYDALYASEDYVRALRWDDIINDQTSLHRILRFPALQPYVWSAPELIHLFNSGGARFIRQIVRRDHASVDEGNFAWRLDAISREAERVLGVGA